MSWTIESITLSRSFSDFGFLSAFGFRVSDFEKSFHHGFRGPRRHRLGPIYSTRRRLGAQSVRPIHRPFFAWSGRSEAGCDDHRSKPDSPGTDVVDGLVRTNQTIPGS